MSDNKPVRQALLRPAFKHLYPGIVANEWLPASALLAEVNTISQNRRAARAVMRDALDPEHFAFRGTSSSGADQVARELRIVRRKRLPRSERPPKSKP
jgi:hypothetical protein